jgi:hypothetical protein
LALHFDKDQKKQHPKVKAMTLWIMPALSLFVCGTMYAVILGISTRLLYMLFPIFLGICFMLIGNYMPKCKHGHHVGIRTISTLCNEENWYVTHRFGGKVMFWGGLVIAFLGFLPTTFILFATVPIILAISFAPMVYSYLYRKKQIKKGRAKKEDFVWPKKSKIGVVATVAMIALTLTLVPVMLFTGNITTTLENRTLSVKATYYSDLTLSLDEITDIVYIEQGEDAMRLMGYGSPRLEMGNFESNKLGRHLRYTYASCDAEIVLHLKEDKILVINCKNTAETRALYTEICNAIAK